MTEFTQQKQQQHHSCGTEKKCIRLSWSRKNTQNASGSPWSRRKHIVYGTVPGAEKVHHTVHKADGRNSFSAQGKQKITVQEENSEHRLLHSQKCKH